MGPDGPDDEASPASNDVLSEMKALGQQTQAEMAGPPDDEDDLAKMQNSVLA